MTTDTAVRVTRMVVEQKGAWLWAFMVHRDSDLDIVRLEDIPYLDFPELKFSEHESTEMPFRYVKGEDGKPVMPEVCRAQGLSWMIIVKLTSPLRAWWIL